MHLNSRLKLAFFQQHSVFRPTRIVFFFHSRLFSSLARRELQHFYIFFVWGASPSGAPIKKTGRREREKLACLRLIKGKNYPLHPRNVQPSKRMLSHPCLTLIMMARARKTFWPTRSIARAPPSTQFGLAGILVMDVDIPFFSP